MATKRIDGSTSSLVSVFDVFEAIKRARIRRGLIPETPEIVKSEAPSEKTKNKAEASDKPKEDPEEHLAYVTEKSQEILFKADTVFPFTLFPDTVTVDREKISVAKRYFFKLAKIVHVPVTDLFHAEANLGPFFGSVRISSRYFSDRRFSINFLWRKDASELQEILQGYIIAHEQNIDCFEVEKDKLIKLLKELGHGSTD